MTEKLNDELWQWVIGKVKEDNVIAKNPNEFDKWAKDLIDISISVDDEGLEDGWFRANEFHHLSSKEIDKLSDQKDDLIDADNPNEMEQCAVEFLIRFTNYWSRHEN